MGRQTSFGRLDLNLERRDPGGDGRRNRSDDRERAVAIADVILENERGTSFPNLGAPRRVQLDQIDLAAARQD